ncbi:MAG: RagB/SusD family nutrient uptake outer membrane protein [Flavisolibacter sp.]
MKRLFIKTALFILAVAVLNSGCKKFLDQEVPGRLTEENFYQTDQDALEATAAIYDLLQAHYNTAWLSMYMVKTMLSDESNAGGSGPGDQEAYQALDDFNHDANNGAVLGVWRLTYATIYRANKVINNVKPDNDLRKRLIAEAKVIRAYHYLDLVSLWGDVPLVIADIPPSQYTSTARSPKDAVYQQIVKDLQEAATDLPNKSAYPANEKYRVSKGTAQALLGKAYLYQEKWNEAATAFETVITSGQFGLEPNIGKTFSKAGEFGVESLFEVSYTAQRNYNWGNFPWDWQPESNIHIQLMGPRSDFYVKAPADSLIGGWGFNTPKKKLYDAFVAAGDVERKKNTVMSEAELKAAGGNWTAPTAWDYEGYFQRKYGTVSTQTSSSGGDVAELNYGNNWRLLRYADVLLMAAEANFRAGNETKARLYLNQVRNRSQLGNVNASGNALFDAIVKERQLELAFEGFRFIDLVRWGLASQELVSLGFQQGKHERLPIPSQDIRTAGLTQNPGY